MVNPLGVIEPMVGWKRAPLSAVAPFLVLFRISVFTCLYLEIYRMIYIYIYMNMSWNCEIMYDLCVRTSMQCLIITNGHVFVIEEAMHGLRR